MKKLIITLGLSGMLCVGCVDLTQEPNSFLTPENIEYNERNVTSLANGLYTSLWGGNYAYNCRTMLMGLGADDVICGTTSKRGTFTDQLHVDMGSMEQDYMTMWDNMYKLIQASNQFIEGLEATNSIKEKEKEPYLGEAYFMRAFAHFNLVRWFGDVPAFTDSKCVTDFLGNTTITRNKVEDIYLKLIVPDLKQAEVLLPNRGRASTAPNSTVCKWAAKACLAEVYLTMAGWPMKQTQYYADARDKALEIITDGGYKLVDHYEDLWKEATKSDDTEHIFALNHSNTNYSNYGKSYFTTDEEGGWGDYLADSCFYERYPNDERKKFNFVTEFQPGGVGRKINFKKTVMRSPAINKYRDYGGVSSPQSLGITPIYRYADVLLMYAEAQNKADHKPNPKAYECINDIRKRAMGGIENPLTPDLSEEDFDKAVFDERGWEFFSEFKRWFQLVRTEKVWEANQFNPGVKKGIDKYGVTKDDRQVYLMPLPAEEAQFCNFPQNPR